MHNETQNTPECRSIIEVKDEISGTGNLFGTTATLCRRAFVVLFHVPHRKNQRGEPWHQPSAMRTPAASRTFIYFWPTALSHCGSRFCTASAKSSFPRTFLP